MPVFTALYFGIAHISQLLPTFLDSLARLANKVKLPFDGVLSGQRVFPEVEIYLIRPKRAKADRFSLLLTAADHKVPNLCLSLMHLW